ncbi:MAG TPA: hypothetical protein VNC23_05810, partial [Lapillicoccus sp.]|nr:hypothetical protein [Lapillicoccus sp.]
MDPTGRRSSHGDADLAADPAVEELADRGGVSARGYTAATAGRSRPDSTSTRSASTSAVFS